MLAMVMMMEVMVIMMEVMVIMMLMLLVLILVIAGAGDSTSACAEDAIEPEVSVY